MMIKTVMFLVVLILHSAGAWADADKDDVAVDGFNVPNVPIGVIDAKLLPVGYSGKEKLVYDVSWTGGLKIGELHLEVNDLPEVEEGYEIRAFVTTKNGVLNLIYPIEDVHVTRVRGPNRLPYHYEVWQKEGYNYSAHRVFEYDQTKGYIRYMKNEKLQGEYQVKGETNNEFSSFFNSRLMPFDIGKQFMVPTFADKRKVDVVVHAVAQKRFEDTIIGPVSTVGIMPVLTFEGLYEKKGDTVIWYTDDECRVPVRINSKIIIGSLTANLTGYENSACELY
ncbi:MAG: DUF3108 domain-containing protein [Desulfobulbaceae bacterium]|nr:DUF3108 domain-containing protein [Desulfobulbaceae bacterium]